MEYYLAIKRKEVPLNAAAAAAKLRQSCPTLCNPIDGSPPGSSVPGTLQARTLEWVAISFSNAWKWKVKVKSLSCVRLLATPWTAAHQGPRSMGFSRQEYWSGVPLPSPTLKCYNMDKPWKHYTKWKKPVTQKNMFCVISFTWNVQNRQIFIEIECRLVVMRGWEGWEWRPRREGFLFG